MYLSRSQFFEKYQSNTLKIAFIGMSNIGKSFRTSQLENNYNFSRFDVDNAIGEDLDFDSLEQMSRWMGYPYQSQYVKSVEHYLELEKYHTLNSQFKENTNHLLDTTGSVIYLSDEVHQKMKEEYLIVCIDVGPSQIDEMEGLFFIEPKPVVWGDCFEKQKGEEPMDALRRCYPDMISERQKKYRNLSDIIIPGEVSRMENLSIERFFEILTLSLSH